MPFSDTKEGQTNSCTHRTDNGCGICDACLGKPQGSHAASWISNLTNTTMIFRIFAGIYLLLMGLQLFGIVTLPSPLMGVLAFVGGLGLLASF